MDELKKAYGENWENEIERAEQEFRSAQNAEIAQQLAAEIRSLDVWDSDLLRQLCDLAWMQTEWANADGETFESVAYDAAKKLGVEI